MSRNWQDIHQFGQSFANRTIAQLSGLETDVASLLAVGASWPQKVRSGLYLSSGGPSGGVGNGTQNRLALSPVIVPSAITVVEANANCTTAAASNVVRAGIYSDDGNGAPASLVLEFGSTFDFSGTGTKSQVISQALPAGIYWVGGALQGGTGAAWSLPNALPSGIIVNNLAASASVARGYYQDSVSGALPSTFTFNISNVTASTPLITLKVQ